MATIIFEDKTTDGVSGALPWPGGNLQVDIDGVLDGADVLTSYLNPKGHKVIIADLSWRSSKGEVLSQADGGVKYLNKRKLIFEIINAGASTNITLWYDAFSQNS